MRLLRFLPVACFLATTFAETPPPKDESISENEFVKRPKFIQEKIEKLGWSMEGLTMKEVGPMTVFHRDGKLVGYCAIESSWKPISPEALPVPAVTKIEYGDPTAPSATPWFTIEDPEEIALWVSAYRNHSRSSHKTLRFVAFGADAGIQNADVDLSFLTGHGCHLGLYFYNGDKQVLYSGHHWAESSEAGKPSPNEVLQALVWDRLQKQQANQQPQRANKPSPSNPTPVPDSTQPDIKPPKDK